MMLINIVIRFNQFKKKLLLYPASLEGFFLMKILEPDHVVLMVTFLRLPIA